MASPSEPLLVWPPVAGLYKVRRAAGSEWYAVEVWFGPPADPLTGELLDRSLRWQAKLDGREVDIHAVWPYCGKRPVRRAEFAYLLAIREWERVNDPIEGQPAGAPRMIDRNRQPPPF